MIIVKLSEILGRKKLKIADVIRETGVTRPTLTSLFYGTGSGINFDTLDKLCKFLMVTPGDLIEYHDIDIKDIKITISDGDIEYDNITVNDNYDSVEVIARADFTGRIKFEQPRINDIEVNGYLSGSPGHKYDIQITLSLINTSYLTFFPEAVRTIIEERLLENITDAFKRFDNEADIYNVSVTAESK